MVLQEDIDGEFNHKCFKTFLGHLVIQLLHKEVGPPSITYDPKDTCEVIWTDLEKDYVNVSSHATERVTISQELNMMCN